MQENRPFLPFGFQFRPTDEELIEHYLEKKVSGTLWSFASSFIFDSDAYGCSPSKIWECLGGSSLNNDEDLYFFTHLKSSSSKGSRICRKVGSSGGSWEGDNGDNIVSNRSQLNIGFKKQFHYENKVRKSEDPDHKVWIMHEYTLNLPQNQAAKYALCRLRKKPPTGKQQALASLKKRKLTHQSEVAASVLTKPKEEACCGAGNGMTCGQVLSTPQFDFTSEQCASQNSTVASDHQCDPNIGRAGDLLQGQSDEALCRIREILEEPVCEDTMGMHEAEGAATTMKLMTEFEQLISHSPTAWETDNLERQAPGHQLQQSQHTVGPEDWLISELLLEVTDGGTVMFT